VTTSQQVAQVFKGIYIYCRMGFRSFAVFVAVIARARHSLASMVACGCPGSLRWAAQSLTSLG